MILRTSLITRDLFVAESSQHGFEFGLLFGNFFPAASSGTCHHDGTASGWLDTMGIFQIVAERLGVFERQLGDLIADFLEVTGNFEGGCGFFNRSWLRLTFLLRVVMVLWVLSWTKRGPKSR